MHRPIKERLEEYLRGAGEQGHLVEFRAHLGGCEDCREEVVAMEAQAQLLRVLSAAEEVEPAAGFYARVMESIEARRVASLGNVFLEPAFERRLIFASLVTVIVLGSYLFYTERDFSFEASSPVRIMAVQPLDQGKLGADPQHDREEVLLSLASYQEE
jgi:predicted anti-sigma-YlaC factor YlaD